jgi:ferredoxin
MAYVIVDTCTKDEECIQVCPVDCIHPRKDEPGFEEATQLYVHPTDCIDCGACIPVCPTTSIFALADVPADQQQFVEVNAAYYQATAN